MACDEPCTDSKTRLILSRERFALASLRNGHLEMPCCLQMRFIVVGQTAQGERHVISCQNVQQQSAFSRKCGSARNS